MSPSPFRAILSWFIITFSLMLTGLASVEECLGFDLQHCRKLKEKRKRREKTGVEAAERKFRWRQECTLISPALGRSSQ